MNLTVAEFLVDVRGSASSGSLKNYGAYWNRIEHGFTIDGVTGVHALGHLTLGEIRASQILRGSRLATQTAVKRRNSRDGSYAGMHYVSAARQLFDLAVRDGLLDKNPALEVKKPIRKESSRHALTNDQLIELWAAAAQSGTDPALDVLLLRFHLETGARREGALNLTRQDLHEHRQTIILREKGGKDREQPLSLTLLKQLIIHYERRAPNPSPTAPVFYYRSGTPLTRRRYNSLFERIQRQLGWAGELGISIHWLRHTAVTNIERVSSYSIAQRFAGHTPTEVTGTYSKATIAEVAAAVARLTGEEHPLAPARPAHPW